MIDDHDSRYRIEYYVLKGGPDNCKLMLKASPEGSDTSRSKKTVENKKKNNQL